MKMDREILFRAKRSEARDWTCGYFIRLVQADNTEKNYIVRYYDKCDVIRHEIDIDTLGEYTGMQDKYKVDIYEGDIVRYARPDGKHCFAKIVYKDARFRCVWDSENEFMIKDPCYWADKGAIEVIGNIYDYPELEVNEDKDIIDTILKDLVYNNNLNTAGGDSIAD